MAPGAVLAKERIKSFFESLQRSCFVETHLCCKYSGFYVGSTTPVRYFGKPGLYRR